MRRSGGTVEARGEYRGVVEQLAYGSMGLCDTFSVHILLLFYAFHPERRTNHGRKGEEENICGHEEEV